MSFVRCVVKCRRIVTYQVWCCSFWHISTVRNHVWSHFCQNSGLSNPVFRQHEDSWSCSWLQPQYKSSHKGNFQVLLLSFTFFQTYPLIYEPFYGCFCCFCSSVVEVWLCYSVLFGCPQKHLALLQRAQHALARVVTQQQSSRSCSLSSIPIISNISTSSPSNGESGSSLRS